MVTCIEEPFAMYFRKSSFTKNISISVECCFLNPNWLPHVVRNGVALDNINDSKSLLATVARAVGL